MVTMAAESEEAGVSSAAPRFAAGPAVALVHYPDTGQQTQDNTHLHTGHRTQRTGTRTGHSALGHR